MPRWTGAAAFPRGLPSCGLRQGGLAPVGLVPGGLILGGLILGGSVARSVVEDAPPAPPRAITASGHTAEAHVADGPPPPEILDRWSRRLTDLAPDGHAVTITDVSGCRHASGTVARRRWPTDEMLTPDHGWVRWSPDLDSTAYLDCCRGAVDATLWIFTELDTSLVYHPNYGPGVQFVDLVWLDDTHLALTALFPISRDEIQLGGSLFDVAGKHGWHVTFDDPAGLTPLFEEHLWQRAP